MAFPENPNEVANGMDSSGGQAWYITYYRQSAGEAAAGTDGPMTIEQVVEEVRKLTAPGTYHRELPLEWGQIENGSFSNPEDYWVDDYDSRNGILEIHEGPTPNLLPDYVNDWEEIYNIED